MKSSVIFLILFLTLGACSVSKNKQPVSESVKTTSAVSTTSANEDSLLTGLERYACFGSCPQFILMIYKSGYAVYQGQRNVPRLGVYTAQLNTTQINDVYGKIRSYNIELKDSSYVNKFLADYPGWKLWVADKNPRKGILIIHEAPPEDLTMYGGYLDALIEQLSWTKKGPLKDE